MTTQNVLNGGFFVYDTSYMFYNCRSVFNMPQKLKIHEYVINLSYMFFNTFKTYYKNNTYKPAFFPINGFKGKNINISHCFEDCTNLYGAINGSHLWLSTKNTFISVNAFKRLY